MKRDGFTLIEVLAAMVFLGILLPVVISALLVSNRAAVLSERSIVAVQLGENRLNELVVGNTWTSAEMRGEFGDDWPGYRWEMRKATWQTTTMTELTLDVFFQVQGREQSVQLSTLAEESATATTL